MSGGATRRVVLRDGVLVVLGLCAGCGGGSDPADTGASSDGTAGRPGAGGDGSDGSDGTASGFDPCAAQPDAGGAGWAAVSLAEHPGLAEVGGGASVDLDGLRLALGQPAEGCFVATSRVCTHSGCDTAYDAGRFVCPCHGAVFDLDGSVISGPTAVPVASYPAAPGDGVVWVKVR